MAFAVSNLHSNDTDSTEALQMTTATLRRNSRLVNKILSRKKRNLLRESQSRAFTEFQVDADSVTDDEVKELRLTINQRERLRMQDLNSAMDELRSVLPCPNEPTAKRRSKTTTLLQARNYILVLSRALSELADERRMSTCHSPQDWSTCFESAPSSELCFYSAKEHLGYSATGGCLRSRTDPSTGIVPDCPFQKYRATSIRNHPSTTACTIPGGDRQLLVTLHSRAGSLTPTEPLDYSLHRARNP